VDKKKYLIYTHLNSDLIQSENSFWLRVSLSRAICDVKDVSVDSTEEEPSRLRARGQDRDAATLAHPRQAADRGGTGTTRTHGPRRAARLCGARPLSATVPARRGGGSHARTWPRTSSASTPTCSWASRPPSAKACTSSPPPSTATPTSTSTTTSPSVARARGEAADCQRSRQLLDEMFERRQVQGGNHGALFGEGPHPHRSAMAAGFRALPQPCSCSALVTRKCA
jgi:hypothetical protein